jgi:PAS domain S-box-containing protein
MNNLPPNKNRRVLVVDDNRAIHDDFRKILSPGTAAQPTWDAAEESLFGPSAQAVQEARFEVDSAYQGQEGVQLVEAAIVAGRPYAMAFVDVRMPPGWDGVETSRKIWALDPNLQVVLCTAYSDYSWGEMFEQLGQRDGLLILKKPFDAVEAFQLAHALTEKWSLHQQARRKMEELEGWVAERTQELARSLSLLNATLESTTDGIVAVDLFGKVVSYNTRFANTWRFPADMLARRDAVEMRMHTAGQVKNPAIFLRRLEELQADPEAEGFDEIELKDGRIFERYVFPQRIEHQCVGSVINWRDITERKRAEEELLWKTAFLEAQVNSSSDGILVVDPQGKKVLQNQRLIDLFKIPPAIAAATADADQVQWVTGMTRNPEPFVEKVRYLYAHPDEISRDEIELKDGRTLDRYSSPVVGKDGRYYGRIWTFRDITERKQADEVLRRTEAVYRAAIAGAGAVPYSSDYQSKSYLFMGEGIEQLIGYAPHEVTGQLWKQIIQESIMASETAGLSKDEAARRMASGEIRNWRCDMRVRTRGGKLRWLADAAVQQLDASGHPVGSMGILQDITERKQNEIFALAFSKLGARLSSVNTARETFDIIKEVSRELFGWDAFCIRLYNAADDSIYSGFTIDTIDGKPVANEQSAPGKPGELYRRIMARGGELIQRDQPTTYVPGLVPFGDVSRLSAVLIFVPIRSRSAVVGILSVQSYIPNAYNEQDLKNLQAMADQCGGAIDRIWAGETLRKTEAQLFQAQKLETIGKLAGGIAHEFNSIMTVIIGQSELLLGDLPVGDGLRENATEIRKAADRAATLTRQLLAYGRKQMLLPEVLDLNAVLTSLTGMIRQLLGGAVDVRLVAGRAIKSVKVDAGQLEQVIINIVMNAADAMPHGGKLTLETAPITLDQNYVSQFPGLKAGEFVLLAITDTGTGMNEEVKARVFDPFFTTKAVGKGPGLGLSACHGIIKQSGGHIAVYSEPGWGTTFKIYLPEVPPAMPVLRPQESLRTTAGTETILLVEDDPALREMAAKLLGRLGYRVLTAGDGQAALTLAQQPETARVDLLFTDVVMPHINGKELAGQVRALFPGAKILFTSAYTEGAIVHQGVLDSGVELLLKPFTPAALAEKVRALLDKPLPTLPDAAPGTFGFSKNQMG